MSPAAEHVLIVFPAHATVYDAPLNRVSGMVDFQELLNMIRDGDASMHTLPSGDRLFASKDAFGPLGEAGSERDSWGRRLGAFSLMKEKQPRGTEPMKPGDERIDVEVIGPAVIFGPVPEGGKATDLTPTKLTKADLSGRLAFFNPGVDPAVLILKALLGEEMPLVDPADSEGEGEVRQARAHVSDEELAECGCPGCIDELARRTVEAGGSTAVN